MSTSHEGPRKRCASGDNRLPAWGVSGGKTARSGSRAACRHAVFKKCAQARGDARRVTYSSVASRVGTVRRALSKAALGTSETYARWPREVHRQLPHQTRTSSSRRLATAGRRPQAPSPVESGSRCLLRQGCRGCAYCCLAEMDSSHEYLPATHMAQLPQGSRQTGTRPCALGQTGVRAHVHLPFMHCCLLINGKQEFISLGLHCILSARERQGTSSLNADTFHIR
eukprot:350649-Chlamydomonas_euryale.AAC.7